MFWSAEVFLYHACTVVSCYSLANWFFLLGECMINQYYFLFYEIFCIWSGSVGSFRLPIKRPRFKTGVGIFPSCTFFFSSSFPLFLPSLSFFPFHPSLPLFLPLFLFVFLFFYPKKTALLNTFMIARIIYTYNIKSHPQYNVGVTKIITPLYFSVDNFIYVMYVYVSDSNIRLIYQLH